MNMLYDLARLSELADGDQEFIKQVVGMFVDNTPKEIERMKSALQNADFKTVGEIAHKIKPSLALLGIESIGEEVQAIEHRALQGKETDSIMPLLAKLDEVCSNVILELKHGVLGEPRENDAVAVSSNKEPKAEELKLSKVLVITNDVKTRQSIEDALRRLAPSVSHILFADPIEEELAKLNPAVIIVDLKPEDIALKCIERIKESGSRAPVLVLYNYTEEKTVEEALMLGAVDFVNKPFVVSELPIRLARLL